MYVFKKTVGRRLLGRTFDESELGHHKDILERSLKLLEKRLSRTKYLCSDQVSIADLAAACELDQLKFVDYSISSYPKTEAWLHHMIDENPQVLEIHQISRKFAQIARK